mgnify:CR=1 FL=1
MNKQVLLVVIAGLVYSRFVGRERTHKVKSDRVLSRDEVEKLRRDPVSLLDPEVA